MQLQVTGGAFERLPKRGRISHGESERTEIGQATPLGQAEAEILDPCGLRRYVQQPQGRHMRDFAFRIKQAGTIQSGFFGQPVGIETERTGEIDITVQAGAADQEGHGHGTGCPQMANL